MSDDMNPTFNDLVYQKLKGSAESSTQVSRPNSPVVALKRGRVRFNSYSEANDAGNNRSNAPLRDKDSTSKETKKRSSITPPKPILTTPGHSRDNSASKLMGDVLEKTAGEPLTETSLASPVLKPRPGVLRASSFTKDFEDPDATEQQALSALAAQGRAQRIASLVGSNSAPASRKSSVGSEADLDENYSPDGKFRAAGFLANIPLGEMDSRRTYDDALGDSDEEEIKHPKREIKRTTATSEAHSLVRAFTKKHRSNPSASSIGQMSGLTSGQVTPSEEKSFDEYQPRPQQFRGGVLSDLLKLYHKTPAYDSRAHSRNSSVESLGSTVISGGSSGNATPKMKHAKWYKQKNQSQDTLAGLIEASAKLASASASPAAAMTPTAKRLSRPGMGARTSSGKLMGAAMNKTRPRLEEEIRITIHIAETLSRQKYMVKLCRALMLYGAPTHRLEEYLRATSRVLEVDASFLYIPGCMIISFDDVSTHTTEVKLIKSPHGVDLGRLKDVHQVYKNVVHDVVGVEEATQNIQDIMSAKKKYHPWFLVFVYGLASACVGPFAFQARLIDLPIAFLLGCILGILQLIIAPQSELYSNVFEVSAAVLTSFLARAFGSIRGGELFCFSALAQSSIALILPGYLVLCASLELQSRSIVAGSVRIVYAIIYTLFLGFGITIGIAVYGLLDSNATTATTCSNTMSSYWTWFFVPAFALCLAIVNQAKWKQTPVMLFIAFSGYVVNFYSAKRFPSSPQISNTLGALAVGILANSYSRIYHGVAVIALLPAIFVQVPSGLAASGSLIQGLSTAESLSSNTTSSTGTSTINSTSQVTVTASTDTNSIVFDVGYNMIQVAIGITVGLFLSALIVYPLGKKRSRSGLFSF
ncbi:hypothetical protein BJ878DRAFT_478016 [Calycina marina]|uniref:Uncharacterized protein n=1 Tax=Calycina marina TaxID=1763456 RepID=A0A9P8CHH7_9HELO|nr:hypothetical protein BJ878DRAFT_478016 [Calycina marina]